MKTKFTKRMLSILLAVLMVVSSIPFTAITAFAATDENLIAQYFVHDATTNEAGAGKAALSSVSESAVVWDRTENAAHFLGSKSETPMVNISDLTDSLTNANGITITFQAKTSMNNTWTRFFELSNITAPYGNGDCTYLYVAPTNGNSATHGGTQGLAVVKNRTVSGAESSPAYLNVSDGEWHTYKIVVGSNRLITFVDGVRMNVVTDAEKINDSFFSTLVSGKLMFGASSFNDNAFEGYIKNFSIVKMATLDIAKATYEDKMANGKVYTNMLPAYESYITLCKYSEELTYNNYENAAKVPAAAADLLSKTEAMTAYTFTDDRSITNDRYAGFASDDQNKWASGTNYSTFERNILYGETNRSDESIVSAVVKDGGCKGTHEAALTYPNVTFLYDGGTADLDLPIVYKFYNSINEKACPNGALINDSNLKLVADYWYGTDTKANWSWLYSQKMETGKGKISASSSVAKRCSEINDSDWYFFANMVRVTQKPDDTEYLLEIYPNITAYSLNAKTDNVLPANSNNSASLVGTQPIRVINYKPVLTAKDKVEGIQDITKYTQGGARNYITALNNLVTKLNDFSLNKYFNGTTNNYSACAAAIKEIAELDTSKINSSALTQDTFRTITAKNTDGTTLGTFKLSNGASANTVIGALNTVSPSQNRDADYHYDYEWKNVSAVTADATYTVTQVAEAHSFVDNGVITAATCTTDGEKNIICSKCEYATTETIPALGHAYGDFQPDWTEYVEGTEDYHHTKVCANDNSHTIREKCTFSKWTQDGENDVRTCSVCGGTQTRVHQADNVTVTFELPNGTVILEKTVAPNTTVDAPALDIIYNAEGHHSYSWSQASYVITENITITANYDGVVSHTSAVKNESFTNVDSQTLTANSCNEAKEYSYVKVTYCSDTNCNYEISREKINVSPLAHTINENSIVQNGSTENHNIECTVCHKVTETVAHSYTQTVNPATCTTYANIFYECECGYSYTEFTGSEYAPHSFGEYTYNGDNTHTRVCSVCDFEATDRCDIIADITEPNCTEPAYSITHCKYCSNTSERKDLSQLTELHSIEGGSGDYYTRMGNKSGTDNTGTIEKNLEYDVARMEIQIVSKVNSKGYLRVYDYNGNTLLSLSNTAEKTDTIVLENIRGYFRIEYNMYGDSTDSYLYVRSIKLINSAYEPRGHQKRYIDNGDFGNGVLGTHRYECSVCGDGADEKTQHNYDLNRSGNNIVVTCSDCGFSQVLHTTADTVTLTENNLFDTDAFFKSYNVNDVKDENNITSNGQVCFRRTDGKAVVVGDGDNYSKHSRANDYVVPVQGGKTYQLDFDASTIYGDLMVFFKASDGVASDQNYFSWPGIRKTGTTIGTNTLEFTVPDTGIKQLHIRIGTHSDIGTNVYCVFSNFALHEKDDPNYRMIKDIPMGRAINDYFTDFGTKDVCHYVYKNSTIIAADGTMATGTTFNRNCNVVKSANHDIYKEFSNGTVAHYYCATCGYNYDKSVSLNMVYRESFDNASVSGSAFTSSNGNGTLANADTGSIVAYAGGQDRGPRYSNVRHNVLKLNANSTMPGNYLKLDTNPLQDPSVAATAKAEGITISFWRHLEQNGATANLTANSGDNTGYNWRNALTFQQDGNSANRYYIEVNGVQSRCSQEGSNYADLIPEYNDKTTKGTPNYTGDWVNIVVTIDPNDKVNGGTIYINGVPRDYNLTKCKFNGTYALSDSFTRADLAAELIDFLTKSDTGFYFNNGAPWEGNDFDMFYDDIRIYTGVMTQLQINEMYGAEDSDTPSTNSITHDPTNVTVYTLKAGTYTAANGSGETYVAQAGKTVGEEFINYYGVDIATQVSNIEYYSFGTGMVIEKSTNGYEWTKVGDSKGHFAYQNEDLFGGKYTEVLSEPLTYAKQGASGGGYLLWAPHVMYNLTLNKWVIYESTSSWGSQYSTIFYCTSDTVYRDYAYQGMIHKTDSSSKCNAIDSDVYYGRDANGIIDKSTLYLAYGSYCWNGSNIAIWGRELTATGENKPGVDSVWNESVDYPCIKADGTSSEGIYVYYYDGYYYMFTTYGGNDNNYTEVYFRSENPNGPFTRYDGVQATAGTGMFFQSSYKNPVEAYTYWSNGHNSVYTVYNDKNEPVLVNAAHSRALTDGTVQSDEGQIITNQTDIRGNIMISNMIATTKSGWMVMFPLQYNGTDTTKLHLTAGDVVGTYDVINNINSTSNSVASAVTMTITACDDQHIYIDDTLFALEYDAEKNVTYIVGDTIEGTFAKHDDTIEFSFFNKSTLQHTWGYQTVKSSNFGHLFTVESYTPANGDTNGYRDHCCSRVGCNAIDLENRDWDAHPSQWENYNNALTLSSSYLQQTAKYSETSRKAYSAEISSITNGVVLNDEKKSAAFIDAKTSAIESAFSLLQIASYTVKLYVLPDVNNKDDDKYITYNNNHLYGEVVPLSVNEGVLPYKWTKAVKEGDQYLAGATDSVSLVVAGDITVYAFCNEQSKDESVTQHKITVLNKYNKPASYIYVADSTEITFDASTISYDGQQFTVDKLPFYQITGYKVNDETFVSGSKYTVTSDIEIKPVYSASQSIVIKLGTDTIKFKNDDASKREKSVRWDDRITLTADSEMMWYADGVPVAKGNTYTFRASTSVTITAQPVEQATETPKSIVSYSVFDKENNKAIIAVSNYQSDNYKIEEQGIIFGTSKNANAQFDRQLIIDKGKKFVANKTTDTGDQFSFSLAFDPNTTVRTLFIVSYVKYEGIAEPVYSEQVTYVDIY